MGFDAKVDRNIVARIMFGNYRHTFRDQNHAEGKKKTKPSDTKKK